MSAESSKRSTLHFLNGLYLLLGVAIVAVSLWLYVEIFQFTRLRNPNHYILDWTVYWPQAVPWIFFAVGLFAIGIAVIGFVGAKKGKKGLIKLYVVLTTIVAVLMLLSCILTLVFADSKKSDQFLIDTIVDGFHNGQNEPGILRAYGIMEKRLKCCGAHSPRDYKSKGDQFPQSCCDTYYKGFYDEYPVLCEFSDRSANERLGCVEVATYYARMFYRGLAAASLAMVVFSVINIAVAVSLKKLMDKKSKVLAAQIAAESKRNLL